MSVKFKTIRCKLTAINTDPVQYKPYMHTLEPLDVYVDINVPDSEVTESGKITVLTVDGLAAVLSAVAVAIEDMATESRKSKFGH